MQRCDLVPGLRAIASLAALVCAALPALGADTDIYATSPPSGAATTPNVVFLLDSTSNWSAKSQNWNSADSWNKCKSLAEPALTTCKNIINTIYYSDAKTSALKRPWDAGFNVNKDSVELAQGQVQLRAFKLVLNDLVCSGKVDALDVNIGVSMLGDTGSVLSNGHSTGVMTFPVLPLSLSPVGGDTEGTCQQLVKVLDTIDARVSDPNYKAPSSANYGAAYYEIFKYYGGWSNPTLAGQPMPNGGSPADSPTGYGRLRYSNLNPLDHPKAFEDPSTRLKYTSPITAAGNCANNYVVLMGNGYPNAEPNNGGPTQFQGIGYTPPTLSPVTSDTSRFADEWSWFMANTDVSEQVGVQRVFTYTVNTYKDKADPDQVKLLKSMASVGGVGPSGYIEVGGDLYGLVFAFRNILINIAAVDSAFSAASLPVSTTTQGAYLNQIFIGMFRPDGNGKPRWVGNLKQYQLGIVNGTLDLVDAKGKSAVLGDSGFFTPLAESFWSHDSVYFTNLPSGTPLSASDLPDGGIVEKGGVAQNLREDNLQSSANRKVYTLQAGTTSAAALDLFTDANPAVASVFTAEEIAWARGEANVTSGPGMENMIGSYSSGATVASLGTTGARHSIHGDVVHSRPAAVNYGSGDVVVYYGSNNGFFHAVDGRKTGTTAGHELWSFVAPEHYGMMKRLRAGLPSLLLPETDSSGATYPSSAEKTPKDYAMDGPIGIYTRYSGSTLVEAILYPAMRRGGRVVYAFDVIDKLNPKLVWKITGGTAPYDKLAQTWSTPKSIALKPPATGDQPVLLFMGGGYDPAEDTNGSSGIGNVVYVIDGRTGSLIAAFDTDHSVPSDITVVDVSGDGVPDRAYFADVRGNLYRVDFPASGDLTASATWTGVTAVKIAAMGGKMFYAPDVVVTNKFVAVMVGSGDREKPLMVSTNDNFFVVKDTVGAARSVPLVKGDLTRVAKIDNVTMQPTNVVNPVVDAEGCYIELATNGEKAVNAPFTIAGTTYFGTNRPTPANAAQCTADLGEAYAYKFSLFCSAPTVTKLVGGGLPPSPVGGIVELLIDGKMTKVPFIIGGGEGGSPFKPGKPTPPISPVRTRLNWHIDNSNR